jgi:hypothetical protein
MDLVAQCHRDNKWWDRDLNSRLPDSKAQVLSVAPMTWARILRVWSSDQLHQHHLRTCSKCTFLGFISDLINQGV